jgi:hypothetical protein
VKFIIDVELPDDKFCDQCKFFCLYDPYQMGGYCIVESNDVPAGEEDHQRYSNIPRPTFCPLVRKE